MKDFAKKLLLVSIFAVLSVSVLNAEYAAGDTPSIFDDENVVSVQGDVTVRYEGNTVIYEINSPDAILELQSLNVNREERVVFTGSSSNLLTNVTGGGPTIMQGELVSDLLMLIICNENGIIIDEGATVDSNNLVLSARSIADSDFFNSYFAFKKLSESKNGYVVNKGKINLRSGASAVFIGGAVHNSGIVKTTMGNINIAGCDAVELNVDGKTEAVKKCLLLR